MGLNGSEDGTNGTLARAQPTMERFLARLRDTGNVRLSCEAADVPRRTVYRWRGRFATFRDAWDEALEDACDLLEKEAWKRAIERGSDRLLMFLLEAHRAEVYNPPQQVRQEITGAGGGPIVLRVVYDDDDGIPSADAEDADASEAEGLYSEPREA